MLLMQLTSTKCGIGHYGSLQELLLGFTSGALCIVTDEEENVVQRGSSLEQSCFEYETKDDDFNAEPELEAPEMCLQEGYVES